MSINNNSNCEVSPFFSMTSGSPLSTAGASVEINNIQLIPSPFVSFNIEKYKVGDFTIGGVLKVTLNGTVVGDSFSDVVKSTNNRTALDTIQNLAGIADCVPIKIECSEKLFDGYGRILSVSSNEGNQPTWVNIAPYTIELELYINEPLSLDRIVGPDNLDGSHPASGLMLKNISENFSYSINEDTFNWGNIKCTGLPDISGFGNRHVKLNFSISAVGLRGCPGATGVYQNYTYGLDAAEKYIISRLDTLKLKNLSLLYNPPSGELVNATNTYTDGKKYLDFRNISINPLENSIEVTGDMIFRPSGCDPDVFTTLNIEQQLTPEGETLILSGNIVGLVNTQYDDIIKLHPDDSQNCAFNDKMTKAETFLTKINDQDKLKTIANCYYSKLHNGDGYLKDQCQFSATYDDCVTTAPTPTPIPPDLCDLRLVNQSITRNLSAGEINFSFTLSNTANCDVIGARKVNIEITHDKPHDNIVEILIPGRGNKGVLIQNLCCNSSEKYDIVVDATLNKKVCQANIKQQTVNQLRACAEKALENLMNDNPNIDFKCWFKTNNQETIGNNTYKLSQTYVKPSCP